MNLLLKVFDYEIRKFRNYRIIFIIRCSISCSFVLFVALTILGFSIILESSWPMPIELNRILIVLLVYFWRIKTSDLVRALSGHELTKKKTMLYECFVVIYSFDNNYSTVVLSGRLEP